MEHYPFLCPAFSPLRGHIFYDAPSSNLWRWGQSCLEETWKKLSDIFANALLGYNGQHNKLAQPTHQLPKAVNFSIKEKSTISYKNLKKRQTKINHLLFECINSFTRKSKKKNNKNILKNIK